MKIDRGTFLAFVSAIGCNGAPAAAPAGVVEIPPQPPQPAPSAAPEPRPAAPPPKPVAAALDAGGPADDEDASRSPTCGWVDPASVTRPSGACSDDKGVPGACATMRSCGGVSFPRMKCEAFKRYLKPRVAQRAVACLTKLGDAQACDACNVYRCGDEALKTACEDASADAICVQIASKCKAISIAECRAYLSGMNAAGRAKMLSCLGAQPGCGFGIFSCTEGLF